MMKQFIFLVFSVSQTLAQTTDAVLFFSVSDTNGVDITSIITVTSVSAVVGNVMITDAMLKADYKTDAGMYVVVIPEKLTGNIIVIQVEKTTSNSSEIMRLYYKSAKMGDVVSGCHACLCTNILFQSGSYVFDMPMQAPSWKLIPDTVKQNGGLTIALKDISMLQNWREQKMK
jgi:hypothetical protein